MRRVHHQIEGEGELHHHTWSPLGATQTHPIPPPTRPAQARKNMFGQRNVGPGKKEGEQFQSGAVEERGPQYPQVENSGPAAAPAELGNAKQPTHRILIDICIIIR